MKKLNFLILASLALFTVFNFASCEKNTDSNKEKATVILMLTDAPALYDAVILDIQEVQLNSDAEGWITIPMVNPGLYNLLDFSNGLDTLLGSVEISAGNLSQMRLILGSDNAVIVDGMTYPLTIPSGSSSGLKINIHQTLEAGIIYRFWLDFDAAHSIHQTGNGKYMMKPVMRMFTEATSGAISGSVFPAEALPLVSVYNSTDTLMAIPAMDGHYMIRGIPAGNYTVKYTVGFGIVGYTDVFVTDVPVVNGEVTQMDTVNLILQ